MKENDNSKNYLLGILGVGIILIALFVIYTTANPGGMQRNTVTVSGMAEKEVMPDEVELYIAVQTDGLTAADVQTANTQKSDKIIEELKKLGLSDPDIETSQYNLYPKYNYDKQTGESTIYGYTLMHVLKVTSEDIKNAGKYSDTAISSGANSIQAVNFKLKTETEKQIKEELLAEASADARTKAAAMASGLGSKLGRVVTLSEGQVYFPMMYGIAEKAADQVTTAPTTTILQPSVQKITASVQVVYEIR